MMATHSTGRVLHLSLFTYFSPVFPNSPSHPSSHLTFHLFSHLSNKHNQTIFPNSSAQLSSYHPPYLLSHPFSNLFLLLLLLNPPTRLPPTIFLFIYSLNLSSPTCPLYSTSDLSFHLTLFIFLFFFFPFPTLLSHLSKYKISSHIYISTTIRKTTLFHTFFSDCYINLLPQLHKSKISIKPSLIYSPRHFFFHQSFLYFYPTTFFPNF